MRRISVISTNISRTLAIAQYMGFKANIRHVPRYYVKDIFIISPYISDVSIFMDRNMEINVICGKEEKFDYIRYCELYNLSKYPTSNINFIDFDLTNDEIVKSINSNRPN